MESRSGSAPHAVLARVREGLRILFVTHPSLLAVNLAIVFLPVLLVQLAAPTFMRGRTSPVPGGAMLGALVVLILVAGAIRIAWTRARRVLPSAALTAPRARGEVLVLVAGSLLVLLLGQSLLSGLAELLGVVRSGPGPGAPFAIDYPRYVVITILAYAWTVFILTLLIVCLRLGKKSRPDVRAGVDSEASDSYGE
jgi:hypothetical protein